MDPLERHPRTVRDPRSWLRFGLTHLTALGGGYAIGLLLLLAVASGGMGALGASGLAAVPAGLLVGALLGLILGTLDGYLVRYVGPDGLRVATTSLNAAVTAIVTSVIGRSLGGRGWLAVLALYVGPAVAVAVVTWRRSPEARRIHG